MKKIFALVISLVFTTSVFVKADEGMWLPILLEKLNIQEMQEMGCKLTAEQIFSINNSSLKDAIVALDYGNCTGELISDQGLILTNHHCGYGEIQAHSSVEHDYLADGFWAKSMDEELPNPGKKVSFLISVKDVTERVLSQLSDTLSEYERYEQESSRAPANTPISSCLFIPSVSGILSSISRMERVSALMARGPFSLS